MLVDTSWSTWMTGWRRNGRMVGSTRQCMSAMSSLRVTATINPTAPCLIQTFYSIQKCQHTHFQVWFNLSPSKAGSHNGHSPWKTSVDVWAKCFLQAIPFLASEWVSKYGLTSPSTRYRSFSRRVFPVSLAANQQCQSTEAKVKSTVLHKRAKGSAHLPLPGFEQVGGNH